MIVAAKPWQFSTLAGLAAGCPAIDAGANLCELNGQEVACNLIRECDHITGASHYEYSLPEETNQANIWELQPDRTWKWKGPDAPNVPPPTIPGYQTATTVDDPVFYQPAGHFETLPLAPPVLRTPELPPPPGTNSYNLTPSIYTPQLGPAPQRTQSGGSQFFFSAQFNSGAQGSAPTPASAPPVQTQTILPSLPTGQAYPVLPAQPSEPSSTHNDESGIPAWLYVAAGVGALLLFRGNR